MKPGFIKVVCNICILLVILVSFDLLLGWGGQKYMNWLNQYPREGDAALVNYNLNAAVPDVAIIGSSTAICHYDPSIIHDSILSYTNQDLTVFNMGMSKQRMAYCYYAQKSLLERKVPKVVIADVWASFLSSNYESCSFNEFRPYIKSNHIIKDMLEEYDQISLLTKSNLYCYNTEFIKLLLSVQKGKSVDGYDRSCKVELTVPAIKEEEIDCSELSYRSKTDFDNMIDLSKKNSYLLFVVLSPRLNPSDTTSKSYKYIKAKCEENEVPFLDFANDTKYYETRYFRDKTHMNYYGAQFFTKELMKDIKDILINRLN